MTEIYLIRHGQTVWNTEKRFQGQTDIELDSEGVSQAKRLRGRLEDIHFDAIYSSDLIRANKTAHIIADDRNMPVGILKDVREIGFGDWEGKSYFDNRFSDFNDWFENPEDKCIPGGESTREVVSRVKNAIEQVIEEHPGQRVAIFTHGGPIRYMLISCLNIPYEMCWKMDIGNTSISVIRWEKDNFHLHCINDCAHL